MKLLQKIKKEKKNNKIFLKVDKILYLYVFWPSNIRSKCNVYCIYVHSVLKLCNFISRYNVNFNKNLTPC